MGTSVRPSSRLHCWKTIGHGNILFVMPSYANLSKFCGGAALWVSVVCLHTACAPVYTGSYEVMGTVVSENGTPLPQAQVAQNHGDPAGVDDQGRFTLRMGSTQSAPTQLTFSAPGYATIQRTMAVHAPTNLDLVRLRPVDLQQDITLPVTGGAPVSVQVQQGQGGVSLTIPPNSLVTPAGAIAKGSVQITMTYWHPEAPLDSAPGLLLASSGNQVTPLATFGMAAIEVRQNNQLLQVSSGEHLTWTVQVPTGKQRELLAALPNLYYLDPNTALWSLVGTAQDGTLTYDPNSGVFVALLPHLSDWNIDGDMPPSNGGCVTGRVVSACDPTQVMANTGIKVYFLDAEETKDFSATTDTRGNYCIPTPVSSFEADYNLQNNESTITVNYLLTGADSISDTLQCDPLPAECQTCDPFYESWASINNFCNKCELKVPGDPGFQDPAVPALTSYSDTCSPATPSAALEGCTFCPGTAPGSCTMPGSGGKVSSNSCTQLNLLLVRPPGCTCEVRGNQCLSGGGCCAGADGSLSGCNGQGNCAACTPGLTTGSPCRPEADVCCGPPGSAPLTCLDNVCVPVSDPQDVQ